MSFRRSSATVAIAALVLVACSSCTLSWQERVRELSTREATKSLSDAEITAFFKDTICPRFDAQAEVNKLRVERSADSLRGLFVGAAEDAEDTPENQAAIYDVGVSAVCPEIHSRLLSQADVESFEELFDAG